MNCGLHLMAACYLMQLAITNLFLGTRYQHTTLSNSIKLAICCAWTILTPVTAKVSDEFSI